VKYLKFEVLSGINHAEYNASKIECCKVGPKRKTETNTDETESGKRGFTRLAESKVHSVGT
jgi:hypothetical protein